MGGPTRRGRGRRVGGGAAGVSRRAGRLPPARAPAGRLSGPAPAPPPPPPFPRPLPPPLPSFLALSLPPSRGASAAAAAQALGAGRSPCCLVPFVAESGSGQLRFAELRRARQGSRAATTEQPRDWPPRAPFAAVPFPGALTPFSGWDCSGGADSAGVAAEATAAAEQGSMFSPGQEEHCALNKEPVKYGELVVLG